MWSAPIGSYGEAIEEEDYEEYGIAPRRRKEEREERERGRSKSRGSGGGGNGLMIGAIACCALSLVLGLIALGVKSSNEEAANGLAITGMIFGGAVAAVSHWILMSNAYEDGVGWMYRVIPFYAVYYIFTNLDRCGRPFLANVVGTVCIIICAICVAN